MSQFAVPDSDTATGTGWSGSGFAVLDEGSPAGGDVATCASGNPSSNLDKGLADVSDPTVSTGHVLRADWRRSAGARTMNGFLELWQGTPGSGSLVATLQENNIPVTLTEITYGLSGAEADAITDYTAIQLRCYYTYTGGGQPSAMEVDIIELETPDAGASPIAVTMVVAVAASSAQVAIVSIAKLITMVVAIAASSAQVMIVNLAGKIVTMVVAAVTSAAQTFTVTLAGKIVTMVVAVATSSAQVFTVLAAVAVEMIRAVAASAAQIVQVSIARLITLAPATVAVTAEIVLVSIARLIPLVAAVSPAAARIMTVAIEGLGGALERLPGWPTHSIHPTIAKRSNQ